MKKTVWSRLMKQNRINVERYKNYPSKFELKIQRYADVMADFKDVSICDFFLWGLCEVTGVCRNSSCNNNNVIIGA